MTNVFFKKLSERRIKLEEQANKNLDKNINYIKENLSEIDSIDVQAIKQIIEKLKGKNGKKYLIYTFC